MTDERIKEEFYEWIQTPLLSNEVALLDGIESGRKNMLVEFYAGFKTAERLAKIEVLEDILNGLPQSDNSVFWIETYCRNTISELKEGK